MTRKIEDLKHRKTRIKFYPRTHIDAVVDDNGNKLSSIMTSFQESVLGTNNGLSVVNGKLCVTYKGNN